MFIGDIAATPARLHGGAVDVAVVVAMCAPSSCKCRIRKLLAQGRGLVVVRTRMKLAGIDRPIHVQKVRWHLVIEL